MYAWNVTVADGATGVVMDAIPKVRFVVNEAVAIPGIFGLCSSWDQPKKRYRPTARNMRQREEEEELAADGAQITQLRRKKRRSISYLCQLCPSVANFFVSYAV